MRFLESAELSGRREIDGDGRVIGGGEGGLLVSIRAGAGKTNQSPGSAERERKGLRDGWGGGGGGGSSEGSDRVAPMD